MAVDLDQLGRLAAEATPGPWAHDLDVFDPDCPEIVATVSDGPTSMLFTGGTVDVTATGEREAWDAARRSQGYRDAAFIAAARTAVPALVAEVRALREALHKYGQHRATYARWGDAGSVLSPCPASLERGPCTCGLDDALGTTEHEP